MQTPPPPPAAPPRAHDLVWVADWAAFEAVEGMPPWAEAAQRRGAPLVVRRARTGAGLLPVGLRGTARSERLAGVLRRPAVLRHASPEMLARQALTGPALPYLDAAPILAALRRIAPVLDSAGLPWGPTGSLGFALATGWPVVHAASDIDLLVRAAAPLDASQADLLRDVSTSGPCRIDLQVDTGHGGFAFAEWARSGGRVLLKTDAGPFLTDDPWNLGGWLDARGQEAP
jgi:phosphoribosyl-dephospho-CoA transferase